MTDFEEWAKGYMRRSANLEQSVRQRWIDMQDSYEAGYLKGYGVGRLDERKSREQIEVGKWVVFERRVKGS